MTTRIKTSALAAVALLACHAGLAQAVSFDEFEDALRREVLLTLGAR